MNFQFYCPRGHLLQADTTSAGAAIVCPVCGTQFIIPAPPTAAPVVSPVVSPVTPPATSGDDALFSFADEPAPKKQGNLNDLLGGRGKNAVPEPKLPEPQLPEPEPEMASPFSFDHLEQMEASSPGGFPADDMVQQTSDQMEILHIPCPNGHILEVPRDMLNEDAMCPHCNVAFKILQVNSLEYRKEMLEKNLREQEKLGKIWLQRAIIGGVIFLLFLLVLFFTSK